MIRTITRTAAVTVALGAGAMGLGTPSAHAEVPGSYSAAANTATQTSRAAAPSQVRTSATLRYGMRGAAVQRLQASLTAAGFEVPQTGWYGPMTRAAVSQFQTSKGLHATGVATPRTQRLLGLRSTAGTARTLRSSTFTAASSTASTSVASSSKAQAAVNFAYAHLGTPYVYGGSGNGGFDCSGLTQAAWASAGVSIPRTSYAQWSGLQSVSTGNLQPGDIVIFYGGGHVGIYVGDGMVIHAPRPGRSVEKVAMSSMPVSGAVRPA